MTRPSTLRTIAAAAALTWAASAAAHHGWSGYSGKAERFTGVIRAVDYGNPHVTVELEAKDRTWHVVLAPPSRMKDRGLSKKELSVGDTATIEAERHETKEGELRAEWIEVGGKRIELG